MTKYTDLLDHIEKNELDEFMEKLPKIDRKKSDVHKRFFRSLGAVAIVTIGLIGGIVYYSRPKVTEQPVTVAEVQNTSGSIDLTFSPASPTVAPNTNVSVDLNIAAGNKKVTGASVELTYDTTKFNVPVVTQGDFLANVILSTKVENGKISFTYGAPPDSGGKSGSGKLATLTFKPKVEGVLKVTMTSASQVYALDSSGNPIAGNSLRNGADLTITSGTAASPAPSVSPNPSQSPAASPNASPSRSPSASPSRSPSQSPLASPAQSPAASPNRSASPTPTPSTKAASPLTSLRQIGTANCSTLSFAWDKLSVATGYHIELSEQSTFATKTATYDVSRDTGDKTFSGLKASTIYYARISLSGIHDFPRYTTLSGVKTPACPTVAAPAASPVLRASPITIATPRPSTIAQATTPSVPNLAPTEFGTDVPDNSSLSILNQTEESEPVEVAPSEKPKANIFQAIVLGWKDIINRFFDLFE